MKASPLQNLTLNTKKLIWSQGIPMSTLDHPQTKAGFLGSKPRSYTIILLKVTLLSINSQETPSFPTRNSLNLLTRRAPATFSSTPSTRTLLKSPLDSTNSPLLAVLQGQIWLGVKTQIWAPLLRMGRIYYCSPSRVLLRIQRLLNRWTSSSRWTSN